MIKIEIIKEWDLIYIINPRYFYLVDNKYLYKFYINKTGSQSILNVPFKIYH